METMNTFPDQEFDLKKLFVTVMKGKLLIFISVLIFMIAAISLSLTLPSIYKSEVLLMSAQNDDSSSLAGLSSQLGGLASIAGVDLGAGGQDKTVYATEVMKSREFINEFVAENNLKPLIMASSGWQLETNTVLYDEDIYNIKSNTWTRKYDGLYQAEPSDLEVHKKFLKDNFSISKDDNTGLIRVIMRHYSPYKAKEILDKLVEKINKKIKKKEMQEAELNISYLYKTLDQTNIEGLKSVLYALIEKEQRSKMLISTKSEYIFKTVDQSYAEQEPVSPNRIAVVVAGFILGLTFGVVASLIRYRSKDLE